MLAIYKGSFKCEDGGTQLASQKRTNIEQETTDRLIELHPSAAEKAAGGSTEKALLEKSLPAVSLGETNTSQEHWNTWSHTDAGWSCSLENSQELQGCTGKKRRPEHMRFGIHSLASPTQKDEMQERRFRYVCMYLHMYVCMYLVWCVQVSMYGGQVHNLCQLLLPSVCVYVGVSH